MKIHIVQKGDTIWEIAKKYGVDFEQVKDLNPQLSSPDMIMPGMKIKIPSTTKKVKKEMSHSKETKKQPSPKPIQQITEDDQYQPKPIQMQQPSYPQQHIPKMPSYPKQTYPSMPKSKKKQQQPKKEVKEKLALPKSPTLDKSLGTPKKPHKPKEQPKPKKEVHSQQPIMHPCYQAMPMPQYSYHHPCQPCPCGHQMMYHQMPAGGMYHPQHISPYAHNMWQQPGMYNNHHMGDSLQNWQSSQQQMGSSQQGHSQTPYSGTYPYEQGTSQAQQGYAQTPSSGVQPYQQGGSQPHQGHVQGQYHQQSPYNQESYPTPPLYPTYRDAENDKNEEE